MIRILTVIVIAILSLNVFGQQKEELRINDKGEVVVIKVDTTKKANKKPDEVVCTKKVNGKQVTIYRGPKGGLYYLTGKTDKNGKPEKRYIKKL